MVYIGRVAF